MKHFSGFFEALSIIYNSIFWLIQSQNHIKLDTGRCRMTWGIDQDLVRPLKLLRSKVIGKKRFRYIPLVWFLQILGKKLIGLVEGWKISYPMYFGTRNNLQFTEFKNSSAFSRFLHFSFSHKTKKWVIFRVLRGLFGFLFFHFLAYPGPK